MNSILTVTKDHVRLLRRDRIFLPALIVGIMLTQVGLALSDLSIEELEVVLFNFSQVGFLLTGATVAILWGSRLISDSRKDGSIEILLASPLSRSTMVVGKFLALLLTLTGLGIILMAFIQLAFWLRGSAWMTHNQLSTLCSTMMVWYLIGAFALFMSSIASTSVALFCSGSAWLLGMVSAPIYQSMMNQKVNPFSKQAMKYTAYVWDLQRFNISDWVNSKELISWTHVSSHVAYGTTLIAFLLLTTCIVVSRKDLVE